MGDYNIVFVDYAYVYGSLSVYRRVCQCRDYYIGVWESLSVYWESMPVCERKLKVLRKHVSISERLSLYQVVCQCIREYVSVWGSMSVCGVASDQSIDLILMNPSR